MQSLNLTDDDRSQRRCRGGLLSGLFKASLVGVLLIVAIQAERSEQAQAAFSAAVVEVDMTGIDAAKKETPTFARARPGIVNVAQNAPLYPQALQPVTGGGIERHPVDDADIRAMIEAQYLWHESLYAAAIRIGARHGVVRLEGSVSNANQEALAEEIAANTRGVLRVIEDLKVVPHVNGGMGMTKVRFYNTSGDLWTTTRIKAIITFDRRLCGSDVRVATDDGVVKLSGTVNTAHQGGKLLDIVHDIVGVRQVHSDMRLPSVGVGGTTASRRLDESPLQPAVHSFLVESPCASAAPTGTIILM